MAKSGTEIQSRALFNQTPKSTYLFHTSPTGYCKVNSIFAEKEALPSGDSVEEVLLDSV